jgi:hypothetical protein
VAAAAFEAVAVNGNAVRFSATSLSSLDHFGTTTDNLRFNYVLASTAAPGLSVRATVNNARFLADGSADSNLANRGAVSSATIEVTPNMELVFATTNVLNADATRGIRMGELNVETGSLSTLLLIAPNGLASSSGLVQAATLSSTGLVQAATLSSTGLVQGTTVSASERVDAGTVSASVLVQALTVSASDMVVGSSFSTSGLLQASSVSASMLVEA